MSLVSHGFRYQSLLVSVSALAILLAVCGSSLSADPPRRDQAAVDEQRRQAEAALARGNISVPVSHHAGPAGVAGQRPGARRPAAGGVSAGAARLGVALRAAPGAGRPGHLSR